MPEDHFAGVTVIADGPIGRLRLDRADGRSVLDHPLLGGLVDAARWFDEREDVRVVVVESAGRAFCSGFDAFDPGPPPLDGSIEASIDLGRQAMNAVTAMRALTIARVHGRARGGGVVLALACDLQVVVADAVLSLPESHLAMPIPWATLPRLVRQIGPMRTKDIVLTAREFTGEQAGRWGMVTEVVSTPAELDDTVDALARAVVASPRLVVEQVLAEVDRLAEAMGSTADGAADIERMVAAAADEGCRTARAAYLEAWRRRRR
ncbi:MAG: enoyl-CoA hydratase/isomerase family protein [Acidimicrobiales bacterium]|nr:enoyl-CoA hydratase/isomerase family protein [Acidimicrobiales bacterium]